MASSSTKECPELPLKPLHSADNEVCVLALGWFWGPQLRFKRMNGVVGCVVGEYFLWWWSWIEDIQIPSRYLYVVSCLRIGYSGGKQRDPTYRFIKDHSESILIEFDPALVSFKDLLIEVQTMCFRRPFSNAATCDSLRSASFFYFCNRFSGPICIRPTVKPRLNIVRLYSM